MKKVGLYTTQLQAGLGLTEETRALLNLWEAGMSAPQLNQLALNSGDFPNVSARRLRNIVVECFAPRYINNNGYPAVMLKRLMPSLSAYEFNQLLFLFTCRANLILYDFVCQVYWSRYTSGYETIDSEDAKDFIIKANQQDKTISHWSESTIRRVASYLAGCCADFGLLEQGRKKARKIISFRIQPQVAVILAYDLHFSGLGDNAAISHSNWQLFGMETADVRDELKRLSLKGFFIVQTAGDVTRISWKYKTWEELTNVITQG